MAKQTFIFTSTPISLFDHIADAGKTIEPLPDPVVVETKSDGVVYERVEKLAVPMKDGALLGDYRIQIYVAQGDSGNWYNAYHLHIPNVQGHSYYPWPKFSEKYPDRQAAIKAAAELVYKKAVSLVKNEKITRKIAVELSDFLLTAAAVEQAPEKSTLEKFQEAEVIGALGQAMETYCAFSRDELKVLAAGFQLAEYSREEKMVWHSVFDLDNDYKLWTVAGTYPTYAAAERKLKELKASGCIETGLDGKISMSDWFKNGLRDAGFEFYRVYGLRNHDQEGFSIRAGSKNWSICQRATSKEELQTAWDQLMLTEKALEG